MSPDRQIVPYEAKQSQVEQLLVRGVEAIQSDEGYKRFLRVMGRFHTYSYRNQLLINAQRPDATKVASYNNWLAVGRQVRQGEKGIKVVYPHTRREVDHQSGEIQDRVTGFGIGNVFDIAQTDGEPLPQGPTPQALVGDANVARGLDTRLSQYLIDQGITIETKPLFAKRGVFYPGLENRPPKIAIDAKLPFGIDTAKTLTHEAAHYFANHRGNLPVRDAETVAEGSAFVVLDHFGLDTSSYSFPYVATWARDINTVHRNLPEIQQISSKLISAIQTTPVLPALT